MGEQDALPSTQDAFPIAEPQVIITPQVTSGRAVDALMKFLPREVMVEVVVEEGQRQRQEGTQRVNLSELQGVSLRVVESTGDAQTSARLNVAAQTTSAIDELAQAVAAKAAVESEIAPVSTALPSYVPPSIPRVSKSRPARKRSRLALPEATVPEAATRENLKSDGAIAEEALPAQPEVSPILELAQVVAAMVAPDALRDDGDAGIPCAASGQRDAAERISAMTTSPIGPSSQLSALDFSRLTAFADDSPATSVQSPASVIVHSHWLSGLSRWLVPDFVGRAIQHPVLQILAGIGVSLLVFWWILGQ